MYLEGVLLPLSYLFMTGPGESSVSLNYPS